MKTNIKGYNGDNKQEYTLNPHIFGQEFNQKLVEEVISFHQRKQRAATYGTKDRGELADSGAKRRPQKGTGQARMGDTGSPHHRGGGVAFGPDGRKYEITIPKKKKRSALLMILSKKYSDGNFVIIEDLDEKSLPKPSTKYMDKLIKNLGLKNILFIDNNNSEIIKRSVKNLTNANFLAIEGLNVLSLLSRKEIVMQRKTLKHLEEMLSMENSK